MSDAIDRQAAIEAVGYYSLHSGDKLLFADKPLKELPSVQPDVPDINVGDIIYRQAAIDEIRRCRFVVDAIEKINGLPSAQPDNDMINLQKEQAYLQGWEEGREALRKEMWEDGRDRLD